MQLGVPNESIARGPWVMWNHIDGPLIHWAAHEDWLTWRERLNLFLKVQTIDEIACRRWPHLAAARARLADANQKKDQP